MRSERQRGTQGQWLRDVRKARGYSNAHDASDALERMTGHRIHYSAWASYESGSRSVGDQHMAWLEEFFGPMPEQSIPDNADLAAAIREQAAAIDRLAVALERQAGDVPTWADAVVKAALAGRQLASEAEEHDEPRASGALQRDPV